MKNLWTPWRMSYILGREGRETGCIFEAGAGQRHDRPALLLYRDEAVAVLLNRFPYANGHLLVAPTRHVAELTELTTVEEQALMRMLRQAVAILRKHLRPAGFNVGLNLGAAAGAGLADHLHFHVVPRWEEDHNFMTVLAEIRTIPEHIEQTFDRLLPDFQILFNSRPSPAGD
ncbi:MAG: HIT family hydrolase [Deltaproteobacteria bacterium RIFOXYD12_FULL_57_12]|nr:MAG: HIT family hydrolase [Deltaproteobacteria bacterium RIFOXYD12_FULL_57_12]